MKKIVVPPLGWCARLADVAMVPLMYLLSGTWNETPQRTHAWNYKPLLVSRIVGLNFRRMVGSKPVSVTMPRRVLGIPFVHLPIFGGWKRYVVLVPQEPSDKWYVGWNSAGDDIGISRIPLRAGVRMLLGPDEVFFYGVDANGDQITLLRAGCGRIGDGGRFKDLPLL